MTYFDFDSGVWERIVSLLEYDASSPMTLASGFFLFAYLIFGLGYLVVRKRVNLRTLYVVLFSLYFYYKLSGVYLQLLIVIAASDFLIGLMVAKSKARGGSTRWWVALSVAINLSILTYFKATGFFSEVVNDIWGAGTFDIGRVVVPAGVSFFVFQSIAYVVDISRGVIAPLKRFSEYLFLLSFFPKMFLGPLVKAREFIPQIQSRDISVSKEDMGRAVKLIAGGLIKYAVLSRALDALFVTPAFNGELGDGGVVALMAIYGFTIRIYCDFSGYSDMAVGVALLLGFRLPDNFDAPYHSATITEFWRRWHISLSTWLREYLYISLGGNRRGALMTYLNLFITMLLGGLWHGVGMTFIIWGALHGIALALHKVWLKFVPNARKVGSEMRLWWRIPATLFTFHLVALGWLFFAARDMEQATTLLHNIAYNFAAEDIVSVVGSSGVAFVIMGIGYLMHALPRKADVLWCRIITRSGLIGQALVIIIAIWMVMQCDAMLAANLGAEAASGLPMYAEF